MGNLPNNIASTSSCDLSPNACFPIFLRFLRKSGNCSLLGSYVSLLNLNLATSCWSSLANSRLNACSTSVRVVSVVILITDKIRLRLLSGGFGRNAISAPPLLGAGRVGDGL